MSEPKTAEAFVRELERKHFEEPFTEAVDLIRSRDTAIAEKARNAALEEALQVVWRARLLTGPPHLKSARDVLDHVKTDLRALIAPAPEGKP